MLAISETPYDPSVINPGFEWYCNSVKQLAASLTGERQVLSTTLPDPAKYPAKVDALISSNVKRAEFCNIHSTIVDC